MATVAALQAKRRFDRLRKIQEEAIAGATEVTGGAGQTGSQQGSSAQLAEDIITGATAQFPGIAQVFSGLVSLFGSRENFGVQAFTRPRGNRSREELAFGIAADTPFGTVGIGAADRTTPGIVQPFVQTAKVVDDVLAKILTPEQFGLASEAALGFDAPILSTDLGPDELAAFATGRARKILQPILGEDTSQIRGGNVEEVLRSITAILPPKPDTSKDAVPERTRIRRAAAVRGGRQAGGLGAVLAQRRQRPGTRVLGA